MALFSKIPRGNKRTGETYGWRVVMGEKAQIPIYDVDQGDNPSMREMIVDSGQRAQGIVDFLNACTSAPEDEGYSIDGELEGQPIHCSTSLTLTLRTRTEKA